MDPIAISAFRCGSKPEQLLGIQVVEEPLVCRRLGMMELVNDDNVIGVRTELLKLAAGEGLNRREDVLAVNRLCSTHK